MSILHDGDNRPTLLEDIETLHRSLKELESIKQYVQIIQHGLGLRFVLLSSSSLMLKYLCSETAVAQVEAATTVTTSSVTTFQDLQRFVENGSTRCVGVEDGSDQQKLHVVEFLEKVSERTWIEIKGTLSRYFITNKIRAVTDQDFSKVTTAAEKLGWPMSVYYAAASPSDRKSFEDASVNLLKLQTM